MFADFVTLTKPGITLMVLITTLIGYMIGLGPEWSILHLFYTLLGTSLLVMGGSGMNQVIEADTDAMMTRTAQRPVATGRISTGLASAFSIFLTMLGSLILFLLVGYNAALVGLISWILYSIIYTYLKRLTTLSTIIGAVPGALPPVIGYTAATGHPGVGGWLLFLIVFVWQFPHFLAIGWMHREDYKKAGIKTLSVTDPTGRQTSRQIVLYSLALLPVSLAPSLLGFAGFFYMIAALVISLLFIKTAWKCRPENLDAMSRPLFLKTLLYLPLLLGLLLLDHSLLTF